jgi:YihY family inner membrane protein
MKPPPSLPRIVRWKFLRRAPAQLHSLADFLHEWKQRCDRAAIFSRSAEIAFELLACTIPLLVLIASLGSHFVEAERIQFAIRAVLEHLLPPSAHASELIANIPAEVETVFSYRSTAIWVSAPLLLWIVSAPGRALRDGLNQIFHTTSTSARAKAGFSFDGIRAALRAILVSLLTATAIVAVTMLQPLLSIPLEHLPTAWLEWQHGLFNRATILALSLLATLVLCASCYKFLPDSHVPNSVVRNATLVAVLFWEVARFVFAYYLKLTPTFGLFYGGHVALAAFGLWLCVSALILFGSAVLCQQAKERRDGSKARALHVPQAEPRGL